MFYARPNASLAEKIDGMQRFPRTWRSIGDRVIGHEPAGRTGRTSQPRACGFCE